MTCLYNCGDKPCSAPESCADYDEVHSMLMMMIWICAILFILFCFVASLIFHEYAGDLLRFFLNMF